MKSNNRLMILLLLSSVAICIFLRFSNSIPKQQITNRKEKENSDYWMQNLMANYDNCNTHIDKSLVLIREENTELKDIIGCEGSFVFFYPNHVCDVCDSDIFALLNLYSQDILNSHLIALVPVQSYRDFYNFNQEYDMRINNILSYNGKILHNQENINRGIFFYVDYNMNICDLYIPRKPINELEFQMYLKKILSKHNIDK